MTEMRVWVSRLLHGGPLAQSVANHGSKRGLARLGCPREAPDSRCRMSQAELLEAVRAAATTGSYEFAGSLLAAIEDCDRRDPNDRRM